MNSCLRFAVAASCVLCMMGCEKGLQLDQASDRAVTAGQAKLKIVTGRTTQKDVIRAFGPPNIVMMGSERAEVWTYDRVAVYRSTVSGNVEILGGFGKIYPSETMGWAVGGGTGFGRGQDMSTVRTATLIIEFDGKGLVKKYDMMTTSF